MEFVKEFLPVVNGGMTVVFCFFFYHLKSLEKDLSRDVSNFKNYRDKVNKRLENFEHRLDSIEHQASKRWSTWEKRT